jgi:hypothetical protein
MTTLFTCIEEAQKSLLDIQEISKESKAQAEEIIKLCSRYLGNDNSSIKGVQGK